MLPSAPIWKGRANCEVSNLKASRTLEEALEAMQRVANWKIAEPGAVTPGTPYSVRLAFRLETSQLARPFQIGALGSNGWSLALEQRARAVVQVRP